ncbi:MAG: asparagine synthase (glutamine-hydrolyzing) [Acidobacteriota bacterium]|nr:asparagine synthase (glutamine-hydrolyzing) [Acidobacteriota bacterium]
MCGIVGAWVRSGSADAVSAVARGTRALAHRGPDDEDVVQISSSTSENVVTFGHRRLAIIDLSEAGHQPMRDPETGNWIVYNGEVYNFKELRRELEKRGCRFRSDCDTEVILQSYRVWGRDCVERWRGMFAAAIWDASRQELFLVRDRLGVKPLYYFYDDTRLLFASELRALLATNLFERKINLAALDSFLAFGAIQDPLTLLEGVASLPAAHTLTAKADGIELQEYWELPLEAAGGPPDVATIKEEIAELLAEAVRLRLVADVPLGVFLSGGIDSSALAMLMRRSSPEQVKAFTIGFADEAFDEARQAKETAAALGVEHRSILLTEEDLLASCRESVGALDQPSLDGVNTYHVARAVKSAGITVALSGLGGDEVFGGYKHFRTVPRMESFTGQWRQLPHVARRAGAALVGAAGRRSDRNLKLRALLLDEHGFPHPYFLARALFLPEQVARLFEPGVVPHIDYGGWAKRLSVLAERAARLDAVNRISYLELKTYVANTLLRDADVMSMRHSLEVRVPFLDHRLLERMMRLPGRVKLDGTTPKPLLVGSLPERLPPGVVGARKRGFTLPFTLWLKGRLRPELEETFNQLPPALEGIVNASEVRRVWRRFLADECSWARPWALYVLYRTVGRIFEANVGNEEVGAQDFSARPCAAATFGEERLGCPPLRG